MALVRHAELTGREKVKLLTFMIGTALFFGVTLLISFFLVIVVINEFKIPADIAPNVLILGLVPPSIATFLLFTKAFGRLI
jgi:uncharacterized BrkB/YihY/UPF0761 family membrane protein